MPQLKLPKSNVSYIFTEREPGDRESEPIELLPILVDGFYIESDKFNAEAPEKDNLYLWGCLVKSWATGINHLPDHAPGDPIPPRPTTAAALVALLQSLGIKYEMPPRFTKVVYSQSTDDTLAIYLPAKELVLNKEKSFLTKTDRFELPAFYAAFFGRPQPLSTDRDTSMYVDTLRVGEYSTPETPPPTSLTSHLPKVTQRRQGPLPNDQEGGESRSDIASRPTVSQTRSTPPRPASDGDTGSEEATPTAEGNETQRAFSELRAAFALGSDREVVLHSIALSRIVIRYAIHTAGGTAVRILTSQALKEDDPSYVEVVINA
jgi:hypothetical protein